ncbi:MAG: DNA mismatch repair endonuclease MutL [Clostridia bacterium]|nr:DNA mismatch repair endonuclease MutL [Clostridia bacterium]
MSKINVLSFEIANLIAAGEVVERPSSVLKELIENSIDSGATEIVAEIKKGGVSLIRVTDNGCGMDAEDIPISLQRHATSKIREKADLDSIMTLGFRGEALAAISSVSELTIISKTKEAASATMLTSEGGKIIDITEVGASNGTTVVVENLFGNVPARRKFLKKDATEASNVTALVERVALSHPEISITLRIDGEQKFKTPGENDLYKTIYSVFGKEFASKLIKVSANASGIKVSGYIGRSDNVKKNRNLQNFFINGRYVKSMTAMAAIEKAYTSYIAPECFPTCVLFLDMHPGTVDVNVHPAKLEVKFSDEKEVFEAVYYTVKSALEDHEYRPEMQLGTQKRTNDRNPLGAFVSIGEKTQGEQVKLGRDIPKYTPPTYTAPIENKKKPDDSWLDTPMYLNSPKTEVFSSKKTGDGFKNESNPYTKMTPRDSVELLNRYRNAGNEAPVKLNSEAVTKITVSEESTVEYKIIGEAFDCYILVESEGALLLIDKHAAHERILFEDLLAVQKRDGRICTQSLILPITVFLSPEELSALYEYSADIENVGFKFTISQTGADIVEVPSAISVSDAETLFVRMLDELNEGRGNPKLTNDIRKEKALYQIACKAAIKGGRIYDRSIIEWLVKKVMELPDITVCPHGRPIAYRLTKTELDRQFERIK